MEQLWESLINQGVSEQTILLVLFLPVVATVVGFARHFIGLKTLSIYAPIVLTFAFIELSINNQGRIDLALGLRHGLLVSALVFATSTLFYKLTKNIRMHYFPKMSLIFTIVSIVILALLIVAANLGRDGFVNISGFSIVMISAVSERLIAMYAKTNFKNTLFTSVETLLLTLFNFTLISIPEFQKFLINSPWFILFIVLFNLYIGQFRGLRIREIWRFRSILNQDFSNEEPHGTTENSSKQK